MKKRTGKVSAVISSILILAVLALSGCGSSKAPDAGSNPGSQAQAGSQTGPQAGSQSATAPTEVKGSITYWTHDNPSFVAANKKFVEDFKKQNPQVNVVYQYFPYDVFTQKMKASYAAKSESDVQQIFGSWTSAYARNGLFEPVPEEYAKDVQDNFYAPTFGGYTVNGKLYGVPKEYNIENGGVLYYPDKLKAAGYDNFPTTYQDLIDAAKKMTKYDSKGNITMVGFDFNSWDNQTYTFLSFLLQQGGSYWKDDKVHVDFTTPEAKKAMQALADLVLVDKVTDTKHAANTDTQVVFFKGRSAMCYRGPWTIPSGLKDFKLTNFQYAEMPSFTGTSKAFAAESGWGEVVSSRSKNKDAAWAFVKFITSKENEQYFNINTYTVPARKDVATSPEFINAQPMLKPSLDALPNGQAIGPLQDIDQFKNIVNLHFERISSGKETVDVALQKITDETNKMIDTALAQ